MSEWIATVTEVIIAGSLILGAALMLLAAIGLIRLPDLPTRMHASTKAGSLGAALTMLAVAMFLPEPAVIARAMATVAFLLLTAPVAAHAIGRAAYFIGVPLWEGTVKDDLAGHYDLVSHGLDSGDYAEKEATVPVEVEEKPGETEEEAVAAGPDPVEGAEEPEEVVAPEPGEAVSDPDLEPKEEILDRVQGKDEFPESDESSGGEEASEEEKESKKKSESSEEVGAEA